MSRYHRLPVAEKRAQSIAGMREPAIACPKCDTMTTAADLLKHVSERCSGPRPPGPGSVWVSWRDALDAGVVPKTLSIWARRGEVRTRGSRGDRQYLLRDLALRLAWNRPVRRR